MKKTEKEVIKKELQTVKDLFEFGKMFSFYVAQDENFHSRMWIRSNKLLPSIFLEMEVEVEFEHQIRKFHAYFPLDITSLGCLMMIREFGLLMDKETHDRVKEILTFDLNNDIFNRYLWKDKKLEIENERRWWQQYDARQKKNKED